MTALNFHKGLWWLPDSPIKQVSGILSISSEERTLETIGEVGGESVLDYLDPSSILLHDVIWGFSSNAQPISLFRCAGNMSQNTACSFALVKYDVQVVAVGAHISSIDEVGNYDVKVLIPELPLWFRPDSIRFVQKGDEFEWISNRINSRKIVTTIENGCELCLEGDIYFNHSNYGLNVNIQQVLS